VKDLLLGIDAGTSVAKAAVFNHTGRELSSAAFPTTVRTPHHAWAEVSMIETWQMVVRAANDALNAVDRTRIAAIGLTGNMVGLWAIDERGAPARDAILWSDGRAQALIERLSAEHPGFMSRIFQSSGSVMQQGCTLPVLRWLVEHEPEIAKRIAHVLTCKDWIAYQLTGAIQLDPTIASVMPGDACERGYSEAMFDLFGLRGYRDRFPALRQPQQIAGALTEAAAKLLGLSVATPVGVGAGDVLASTLGVGAAEPGAACSLLGTNILNCVVTATPTFEPPDLGVLFCLPPDRWLKAMLNVSGTTSLDWFITQFCTDLLNAAPNRPALFQRLEALAAESPLGGRGVIYLPYLSPQGITAPFYEPAARAEWFGLTAEHTRADLIRAMYEGVALSIRDGFAAMNLPVREIRLSGGGAKSAFWSQMIADCTGKTVLIPAGSEFGARGAALLAAVGIGWFDSEDAAIWAMPLPIAARFEPDGARHDAYSRVFEVYSRLRSDLRGVWNAASRAM
jgi:sugar (pentulose or hexulose) kinase